MLESTETSELGGSINANTGTTSALRVGDDKTDEQYKSVVSFDTSAIPDGATIVSVTLRLRRGTVCGHEPVHHARRRAGSTFRAAAYRARRAPDGRFPGGGDRRPGGEPDRRRCRTGAGRKAPQRRGSCGDQQDRGRRSSASISVLDDNDNGRNDYIGYYSGDNSTPANRPQLVVTYQ